MKKLNTTLFDLDDLYLTMSYAQTWSCLIDLKDVRNELIEVKEDFINEMNEFNMYIDDIIEIDTQLIFLNKNIKTFENALLIHESKVLEKRPSLGDLSLISLN